MDQFQDIRPYHDDEVRPVLDGLIANPDFIAALGRFSFPRLYRSAPGMVQMLVKQRLKWQMRNVKDVASMQRVIAIYMDQMIETTTSKLTHSGLDDLPRDKTYLFVSNHRDIAMDPGFVNYMLYHAGFDTVYIAIGDNLLKRPFVTDLMRLNKSFIVRRGLKGRELLKSSKLLSEYIHHCIESRHNVWIAQREGRAKDGVDRTDTALLKMLAMAKKSEGFQQALNSLHIVPVAISYEFDPCDALKADELYQKETTGTFQKTEQSDIHSIVTGLVGFKGHVHVAFGKEIVLESDDVDAAAAAIDQQIIQQYCLHSTNHLALHKLIVSEPELVPDLDEDANFDIPVGPDADSSRQRFEERLAAVEPGVRTWMLRMYANPVISRYAAGKEDPFARAEDREDGPAAPDEPAA